jgi:hypothetical protein
MKMHSVFLRSSCILPDRLDPLQQSVCEGWSVVEEISAPVLDTMIRQAGWHFMWLQGACSRRGFGSTQAVATHRAVVRALKGVSRRFNAAEFDAVHVTKYPGFQIANVTVQPRQIQQHASLNIAEERHPHPVPA